MAFKMKYTKGGFPYKSALKTNHPHIWDEGVGEEEVKTVYPGDVNILAGSDSDSTLEDFVKTKTTDDDEKVITRKIPAKKVIEKTLDPIPVIPPKKLPTTDDASLMTKKSPLTKHHYGQVIKEKLLGKKREISYGNPDGAHTDVKTRTGGIAGGTKRVEKVYDEHGKLISKTKTKTDKKGNVKTKTKEKSNSPMTYTPQSQRKDQEQYDPANRNKKTYTRKKLDYDPANRNKKPYDPKR